MGIQMKNPSAILLGSKPAAGAALIELVANGWDVKAVVASDSEASWVSEPSLRELADGLGIATVSEQDMLTHEGADLVISYMYRSRVKPQALRRGKYALNFHAGPLPEFGGWAFYNLAILEDAAEYGCTCHIMDDGFDTGPLVKVRRFSIDARVETAVSLEKKSQTEMLLLFREIMTNFSRTRTIASTEQEREKMRYLSSTDFESLKRIPDDASEEEADRIARAFWYPPYNLAYVQINDRTRVEVIPAIVKSAIATQLHQDDLTTYLTVLGYKKSEWIK